jgi:hypothetical protein
LGLPLLTYDVFWGTLKGGIKWVGINCIPEDVGLEHCFGVNWVGINWIGMPWDWVLEGTDARLFCSLDFWSMFVLSDLLGFFFSNIC